MSRPTRALDHAEWETVRATLPTYDREVLAVLAGDLDPAFLPELSVRSASIAGRPCTVELTRSSIRARPLGEATPLAEVAWQRLTDLGARLPADLQARVGYAWREYARLLGAWRAALHARDHALADRLDDVMYRVSQGHLQPLVAAVWTRLEPAPPAVQLDLFGALAPAHRGVSR